MRRIIDACRAGLVAMLCATPCVARPILVVGIASDVQRVVVRTADAKLLIVSRGDRLERGPWYLAGVRGAEAIFESKAPYKGTRVEIHVTAGQSVDFDSLVFADAGAARQ